MVGWYWGWDGCPLVEGFCELGVCVYPVKAGERVGVTRKSVHPGGGVFSAPYILDSYGVSKVSEAGGCWLVVLVGWCTVYGVFDEVEIS